MNDSACTITHLAGRPSPRPATSQLANAAGKGSMSIAHSAKEVAGWMFDQLKKDGVLREEDALWHIHTSFGEEFTYDYNGRGHLAIHPMVLSEFRRAHDGVAIWSSGEGLWYIP